MPTSVKYGGGGNSTPYTKRMSKAEVLGEGYNLSVIMEGSEMMWLNNMMIF